MSRALSPSDVRSKTPPSDLRSESSERGASAEVLSRGAPFGRFLLVETRGGGATFEVHRAKAFGVLGFEKDLAVKILRSEVEHDEAARDAIVARAKRSIELSHANVLGVMDLGVATLGKDERTYLVTELARGPSLAEILEREHAAPSGVHSGAALALGAEVARALDHAHRRRSGAVIHGALSTRQIFVTSDGEVKVGDFAIGASDDARCADDLVALGAVLREVAAVVRSPESSLIDAAARLESGEIEDAGTAHELLMETAYAVSPDAHLRDPAKWVGESGGAPPPSLGVGDFLAEPELCVPGREIPLVVTSAGGSEESRAAFVEEARRAGAIVLAETPALVLAFGLVDPDGRDTEAAFSFASSRAAASGARLVLVTTGVLERAEGAASRLVFASRSDLLEIAATRPRSPTASRVAASSRASLAARGAFTFEVDAEQPELSWLIGASGATQSQSRFVGRSAELHALAVAVFEATRGGSRTFTIVGPRGSGKTRLLVELERRAAGRVTVALARTPRRAEPLDGLGAAIREVANARTPDEIESRLRSFGLADSDRYVLTAIAGVARESEPAVAAMRSAVAELLRKVAHGRPLVVAFDDAHRLDAATRAIVNDLADDPDTKALFVFLEGREPSAADAASGSRLLLAPLDDDAVAALLSTRLGARLIPPDAVELVVAKTAGLPQAILDFVRELAPLALVQVKNGVLVIDKRAADVAVRGAEGAQTTRVARLDLPERAVLSALHVLSSRVAPELLAEVAGLAEDISSQTVDLLASSGLVVEWPDGVGAVDGADAAAFAAAAEPERARIVSRAATALERRGASLEAAACLGRFGDAAGAAKATLDGVRGSRTPSARALLLLAARVGDLESANDVTAALEALAASVRRGVRGLDLADALAPALSRLDGQPEVDLGARARRAAAVCASSAGDGELAQVLLDQADASDPTSPLAAATRLEVARRLDDPELGASLIRATPMPALDGEAWLDFAEVALFTKDAALARDALQRAPASTSARHARLLAATLELSDDEADRGRAGDAYAEAVRVARADGAHADLARSLLAVGSRALSRANLPGAFAAFEDARAAAEEAGDLLARDVAVVGLALIDADSSEARAEVARDWTDRARARGRTALARTVAELRETFSADG